MLSKLYSLFLREPVIALNIVQSIIVFLASFGLKLTLDQSAGLLALVGTLVTILTRALVTPNSKVISSAP